MTNCLEDESREDHINVIYLDGILFQSIFNSLVLSRIPHYNVRGNGEYV